MNRAFLDYYRCPEEFALFEQTGSKEGNGHPGYFRFGEELVCYGSAGVQVAPEVSDRLPDALSRARIDRSVCFLPFDPTEIAHNLRYENYVQKRHNSGWRRSIRNAYYHARPALPVSVRRHLQRIWLLNRRQRSFPRWPVDRTVDRIFEKMMLLSLQAHQNASIPFIWFWPEGKTSCAILTHDVETASGLQFVPELMDIDDSFGFKSSFQIVPEKRYCASENLLSTIRSRGFELNVHDLNHDGHLYDDQKQFLKSAAHINRHAERLGSSGFRSGALYRNLEWYGAFSFAYDMSVPNVAHLDPQSGGCCTVMPFFVGNILELPLTTTQDYSLFNILGTYSLDLWREQIDHIMQQHGIISFIVHPDYIVPPAERATYLALLEHLADLRANAAVWAALPGEVDNWWRQRSKMRLVRDGSKWRIEGPGSDRARVAYAVLKNSEVEFRFC